MAFGATLKALIFKPQKGKRFDIIHSYNLENFTKSQEV